MHMSNFVLCLNARHISSFGFTELLIDKHKMQSLTCFNIGMIFFKCFQTTSFLTYVHWVGGRNKTLAPRPGPQYLRMNIWEGGERLVHTGSWPQHLLGSVSGIVCKQHMRQSLTGDIVSWDQHPKKISLKAFKAGRRRNTHAQILPSNLSAVLHDTMMYSINLQGIQDRAYKNAEKVRPSHHNYYQKFIGYFQC